MIMRFPRWVPGSYFMREPLQYVDSIEVKDHQKTPTHWNRIDVDGLEIQIPKDCKEISIQYRVLCFEMTVRSNHMDESHLHLMPPFTWWLPESGIDVQRMDEIHTVKLSVPKDWSISTQIPGKNGEYFADGRDELLDGIMEANPNRELSWIVNGCNHRMKWWDAGGFKIEEDRLNLLIEDLTKIIEEHHALFGIPEWKDYLTVFHFTENNRGGLEHLRSQTSMMPRKCLQQGYEDDYNQLLSLFSHEYLHQWNVKRLKPKKFIPYDLQKEVHTDLLWWFEGGTSWLGDMICLRSGAWDFEAWCKDWKKKLERHFSGNGMHKESLCASSHDAWIHLYRPNPYARESRISYYLEGELVLFCLDAELRYRSKGLHGVDDLMVELYKEHGTIGNRDGIDYKDIRTKLTSMKGGRLLGKWLDRAVREQIPPDINRAMTLFGLKIHANEEKKVGWFGLRTAKKEGRIMVSSFEDGSPARAELMPQDEIIAVDGSRILETKQLQAYAKNHIGGKANFIISRQGVIQSKTVEILEKPQNPTVVSNDGNKLWKRAIASKI